MSATAPADRPRRRRHRGCRSRSTGGTRWGSFRRRGRQHAGGGRVRTAQRRDGRGARSKLLEWEEYIKDTIAA